MSLIGARLCARYAFMPNKLNYCGPDANKTLFEYVTAVDPDKGLVEMLEEFKGAWPNLTFIAHANGIADPLNEKVVEAYWLGNSLLSRITAKQYVEYSGDHFKGQLSPNSKNTVLGKIGQGGRPHHNFYVYYLFGLRGKDSRLVNVGLSTVNQCRISWGKINKIIDEQKLLVESEDVGWDDYVGKPYFFKTEKEVYYSWQNQSFISSPQVGDYVSVHWNWVCDQLTIGQTKNLMRWDRVFLT